MPYTAPMVTQTREPSEIESPVREITVSMPLPKKVAKNPPNPRDPSDVDPSVGFIADLEARNFFKTLKTKKEPFYGNDGYYYVAQYGSPGSSDRNMHNEIWVFAMNERSYKYLEFNDQTADGRVLPKCLRGVETMVWEKMDQSDIPLLTRKQCSTTYCQASNNCPKAETEKVEGIDDMSIRLKIFKGGSRSFVYTPPTCHYDTASHASLGPLVESLKASDVSSSEINLMVTVVMEKREELDGKNSCQKFFKVKFVAGGAKGSRSREDVEMKEEAGLQMPKTVEALHQGEDSVSGVYSKCFGGNAYYEPTTIASTAKMLMERLKDKKKCFLGDHISVVEYHPQYRLFDRHNEVLKTVFIIMIIFKLPMQESRRANNNLGLIHLDADPDCSDQEGRPEFTFNLPLSKDYSRTDMRPSLGDQCDTHHQCPNTTTIMRLENNLEMFQYAPGIVLHVTCLVPLKVNAFAQPGSCETVTTVSTMVPGNFADNPLKPIEDTVSVQRLEAEKRFIRSLYKGKVGSGELERHLIGLIVDVGNLKPFGLEYNPQAPKDGQDVIMSEETGDERKEDASDGKVALPKPEGCSESVCPTVYVTKNHSNFMELLLPSHISSSEINLMVTVVMEKREELDGKNSCQKFFKVKFVAGGAKGSRSREDVEMKEEAGLQMPKTVEALHQGEDSVSGVYSKCFGGNAYYEPTTITSTAKLLMERLKGKKKCFLGDHISVVEYHPQYRLFDRHNEVLKTIFIIMLIFKLLTQDDRRANNDLGLNMWLATYSDADAGEELLEVVIEVRKAPKDGQDVIMSEETGDERKEDASDGKVALPKPEGCSESVCPTVYVTKNHSNFMELLLPSSRSVCHLTKLCGDPRTSGRQLIRPILGYFNGDNSANKKIKNFAVPLFKVRLYSAEEEEKGISPCEREYQACVRLPDEYKDIPEPNNKEPLLYYGLELARVNGSVWVSMHPETDKPSGDDNIQLRANSVYCINGVEANRPLSCHGECPEYELLCSSPEYAVRRYKSGLWVSTSVRSPSITKANLIGGQRLYRYLKGENHEKIRMAPITPLVLQVRMSPGDTAREVTVSMMIPTDVASNPPKPTDPKVVIDLVPETIVYVKSFPRQSAGFIPEREAGKFLQTLADSEELIEHESYFHIAQYDSLSSGRESQNEIWIFAINEVTYRMLQVTNRLGSGRGIPRCLRQDNMPLRWTKMNPANVPVLTRDRCPSSFCEGPHCPKYEIMERVGDTIEKRHYTDLQAIGYVATSCQYDTAVDQSYMPLWQRMNDTAKFVCTESTPPSCTYYEAYHKALHPILSYINGKNKDGIRMNMTKPLFGHVVPSDKPCGKSFVLCMYLSEKYFNSPPQPLTDSVRISYDENEFVAYEKSFVGNFESALIDVRVRERIDEMLVQLDGLEPFGVKYNPKNVKNKTQKQVTPSSNDSSAEGHLPTPTSCHSQECLPVRVVKDYGKFLEVYFPKVKGVYTQQNVCESGTSGRLLLQPIHRYFQGYNKDRDEIGEFSYPVSLRYRLFFDHGEEVENGCNAVYEMNVALPARYANRDIPEPIAEKMKTFERNGTYMYVVPVSGIYSLETIKDKTYHLLVDLTQENLAIQRYYSVIFTYDPPFTDIEDRMTYIGLVKDPQNGDGSESQKAATSKEKEQVTQQEDE
uniref:Uncharacterized protein n=1 Tax=Branchiostoma floridae TaxID=7739 RepID=C3Z527_BRAFL|eukprot:XP_002596372.1 hypothetical protein BRAFLDRAFT_76181 [Branchiostoma floridae]